MFKAHRIGLLVVSLILLLMTGLPALAVTHPNNIIYLPHGYFCTAKTDDFIQSEVNALAFLSFNYQMCNLAAFDSDGTMNPDNYCQLEHWIQVSRQTDPGQKIIGYVNGTLDMINNPSIHQNMVDFCGYLVTTMGCDGIHLDFEPMPMDNPNYLLFMQMVRNRIGTAHLSVAAPMSNWTSGFINQVSGVVDMICIMCYDTVSKKIPSPILVMLNLRYWITALQYRQGPSSTRCRRHIREIDGMIRMSRI